MILFKKIHNIFDGNLLLFSGIVYCLLYGFIDKSGRLIISEKVFCDNGGGYTFASDWNRGFVDQNVARLVIRENNDLKYVYIDKTGKVIWEME